MKVNSAEVKKGLSNLAMSGGGAGANDGINCSNTVFTLSLQPCGAGTVRAKLLAYANLCSGLLRPFLSRTL